MDGVPVPSAPPRPAHPARPVVGPHLGSTSRWWRRFGWTMAAVWLTFLVDPFAEAARNPDRAAGVLGMAALVAFALVYLRPWMPGRRRGGALGLALHPLSRRQALRDLVLLLVLAAASMPGAGLDGLSSLVFVCTYGLLVLPMRWTLPGSVLVLGTCAVVGWTVPGASTLQGVAEGGFFACVAVIGFSGMAQRTRQLAAAQEDLARLAVAEERTRFARDLHDLLGHSLTVVTLKAELAGRLLETGTDAGRERAATEVADVERLARDALADVRAALAGYREVSLGSELAAARQALAAAGIEADLPGAVDDVPAAARELFAWAVREGVTNVVRHSGATRCRVALSPHAVAVEDDGRGPCPGAGGGSGLAGLADRASAAGAALVLGRSSAGGFSLRVQAAGQRAGREDPTPPEQRSAPVGATGSSRPARPARPATTRLRAR